MHENINFKSYMQMSIFSQWILPKKKQYFTKSIFNIQDAFMINDPVPVMVLDAMAPDS